MEGKQKIKNDKGDYHSNNRTYRKLSDRMGF